jgi:uncharacterized membrane protein
MYALLIIARILHVLSGIMWVGVMVFNGRFLGPALEDVGPDAGKVMAALAKRGFLNFMPAVGAVSILSGAYLYWHASVHFEPDYMKSGTGMTFGIGATLAILAYIIGMVYVRPAIKTSLAIGPQMAAATESERQGMMAQMQAARRKSKSGGHMVGVLVVLAAVAMSIARYV